MVGGIIIGIVVGIALTVIIEVFTIRATMVLVEASRFEFDETVEMLEEAIMEAGWEMEASLLLNDQLKADDIHLRPKVHLFRLYKADYAEKILKGSRHMACFMPFAIAVFEAEDGSVKISRVNAKSVGKVLGGVMAQVLGKGAAEDEERILRSIRKLKRIEE